jgi:hypothetical protein
MPQWHHIQFKELLVMVENFGMFHFFLTWLLMKCQICDGKNLKTLKILLCFSITHFIGKITQLNVWHYFTQGWSLHVNLWHTPRLLDGLNYESKGENNERKRSWGVLFSSQHFGGRGVCWSFEIGTGKSDKQVNYSRGSIQTK